MSGRRNLASRHWKFTFGWLLLALSVSAGAIEDARYLRIGTGSPGENQFSLGSAMASAISSPPGLPPCARGATCGVAGLIAVASATNGSIANIDSLVSGRLDAALVQADVPHWAATGSPPFQGQHIDSLRAVANLTQQQLHLVVLKSGNIRSLQDIRGKRISLGEAGSGTQVHARQLLAALGLKDSELKENNVRSELAADEMSAGRLDAFFVMDSAPVPVIAALAKSRELRLIAITGPAIEKLRRVDPLLMPSRILANAYDGVPTDTPTIAVGLTLVVSASLPDDLVYGITKALWQIDTQKVLNNVLHGGTPLELGNAQNGLGIALHPGALRYYTELPAPH
jgi:TRAP transporter TAXI family solute receptor